MIYMQRLILFTFLCISAFPLSAQDSFNMILEGHWDNPNLPVHLGLSYTDIWGYTAPDQTEVAMVGTAHGVYFFDVTDPANIVVIDSFELQNQTNTNINVSGWRDFKTYGHYAYAVSDQGSAGLAVFDLQDVPNNVTLVHQSNQYFNRAHNIWIDQSNGLVYLVGTNSQNTGVIILDADANPSNPDSVTSISLLGGYVHDIHVVNDTAYASHGNFGMVIYDFSTPNDPQWIATIDEYIQQGYNHSSWLHESGNILVFCDETHGTGVKRVDITDPTDLGPADFRTFRSALVDGNFNSVAHNPFLLGNLAYVAYYHDGVQVYDIADPNNIFRVAYYDTYPGNTGYGGFDGCWGLYPYLPSGNIIASDTENGLYVLSIESLTLPLEFLTFEARLRGEVAELNWNVAELLQGDQFVVEAGTSLTNMKKIGQVEGIEGKSTYSFSHPMPGAGIMYFRVRGILKDGSERITPVRALESKSPDKIEIYPTVADAIVHVKGLNPDQSVALHDGSGRLVRQMPSSPEGNIDLDMAGLTSGIYHLTILDSEVPVRSEKIIVP